MVTGASARGKSDDQPLWREARLTTCLLAARGRATIEQAKGILMARHAIDADKAFERLRGHSQHNGRKLVDVAEAVVASHLLLLPPTPQPSAESG
jgi:AmiR/NasT family two-component response regulator